MRAKFIYEKFKEESDPIKDMGIGINTIIYDVKEKDGEISFKINDDKVHALLRKYIEGINDNEIERFMSFTFEDIINEIPIIFFIKLDIKFIDKHLERRIRDHSFSWMRVHSDEAINKGLKNH
jgi:hypothetical protein